MIDFTIISETVLQFSINNELYNDTIISKVLYWISDLYIISCDKKVHYTIVTLENSRAFSTEEIHKIKFKISQDLIDFKVRDIVNNETKQIRELLLIKAFANNDEFDDYNIIIEPNKIKN